MANPDHLKSLKRGVQSWNKWRRRSVDELPDLENAQLSGQTLDDGDFRYASMVGVNLRGASLRHANFTSASVFGADLSGCNLELTNLSAASLDRSNLSKSDLSATNFMFASLRGVDFGGAQVSSANFGGADLSGAFGLEHCRYSSPSVVDFSTIARSGALSVSFLRGCGLPDILIDYLPSVLGRPFQFYSCFISYSTKDQEFADRLHSDLQDNGVRCWFAPKKIQGGKKLHDQIIDAIRLYDRLLLILTSHSIKSEWVRNEIFHARQRERNEKRRVLFPIRLISFEDITSWNTDVAPEVSEYFIPDFSDWKNGDSYKRALQRLVSDLKAE